MLCLSMNFLTYVVVTNDYDYYRYPEKTIGNVFFECVGILCSIIFIFSLKVAKLVTRTASFEYL